jgi:thioredoxin reductase (NADPH)
MYDLIIIGAGPAGLTAALYAARFRLETLILEKMSAGGQILLSPEIENFPGFPGGITTQELVERFRKQAQDLGAKIEAQQAQEITAEQKLKIPTYNIKTQSDSYQAKGVIVACGAQARRLGVKGEEKFIGRGVSYCATCDGPLFRNKEVAVIGGGDRAIEEAHFLSGYAQKIFLIHRRSELRASRILEERARANTKISFILDSVVEEIQGVNKVEALKIKNTKTNSFRQLSCAGVFIFVGITPNTPFLKNLLETDREGFIITDEKMQTSRPGIFACGDCRKKSLYQVVAADAAHKYLLNQ